MTEAINGNYGDKVIFDQTEPTTMDIADAQQRELDQPLVSILISMSSEEIALYTEEANDPKVAKLAAKIIKDRIFESAHPNAEDITAVDRIWVVINTLKTSN